MDTTKLNWLSHSEDTRLLLLPTWVSSDASSSSVPMEFEDSGHSSRTFWASSNAIMSHVWKNHRMSLRSTLLQWKSAHIYIFGSRLSPWFGLQLTQISSGLKVATFYVDGSGLCGLCADPVFSKLHLHRFVLSVLFSWAPKSSITQKTES